MTTTDNFDRPEMDVLSPRSTNVPMKPRVTTKKLKADIKPKHDEKPQNPDRIDDKWRPPVLVTEPGSAPETYITGRKLGKGGFAVAFEGKTKRKSEVFALKVVKTHIEQKKMLEKFRTELQIHAKMCHPNIVGFHRAFTFEDHTYVILELCHNGNLTDMVKARSCLSLPEVRRFMVQICGGVKYMHRRSVIHRDLKMGNIFLDSHMNIKIGDFGLAAVMADEQDRRTTLCGTPNYIAPEILSKSSTRGHDNKVDTWAIGVICYAMLMGTPPFQSKTQQEIYTKLKTLEYEWKIDSKNYIPQSAKEFVASCLNLNSAERPEMDDLVEYEFFKVGAIAEELNISCLKVTPMWLENADPRGDRVRAGYGVEHSEICKAAGVGRTPDGRIRPAAGERSNISALVEIEIENRQDTAPTIPLPEGFLYQQVVAAQANWKIPNGSGRPRSRKVPQDALNLSSVAEALTEVEMPSHQSAQSQPIHSARVLTAPRPAQSFAAQQRQQALPTRAVSGAMGPPVRVPSPIDLNADQEPAPVSRGYLRERPVRSASIRTTRSKAVREPAAEPSTSRTLPKSNTIPSELDKIIANNDLLPVRKAATIGRSASHFQVHSRPSARNLHAQENATTRPITSSQSIESAVPSRVLRPIPANDRQVPPVAANDDQLLRRTIKKTPSWSSSSDSQETVLCIKPKLISVSDDYSTLPHSSPSSSLDSLRSLHDCLSSVTLGSGIERVMKSVAHPLRSKNRSGTTHPRVDKWVDYSTKHGIAYILSDDTVGMILKSSEDNSRPSACVVVKNGRLHTVRRAKGLEQQMVQQDEGSVEFYERSGSGGDQEVKRLSVPRGGFGLDLKRHKDAASALISLVEGKKGAEAERAKVVGLLDKFGKYMNKVTESGDDELETLVNSKKKSSGVFVDFYQRLGNVGVWRFRSEDGEGAFQFNFPDHTKVVAYQKDGEWMADVIHLDAGDARALAKGGSLSAEAFERRGLLTLTVAELTGIEMWHEQYEVVRSNEVKEKLAWIRGVIGCWVKNGGIGRMGEERVGWSGLCEKREGSRVKLCWVTVGRDGGDGDMKKVQMA